MPERAIAHRQKRADRRLLDALSEGGHHQYIKMAIRRPGDTLEIVLILDGALDTGLGPHGVDVAAEQAVMAPSCLSGMSAVTASIGGRADISRASLKRRS